MRIPDLLTCLLRNLYAGQEATVRTRSGTADWFQMEKAYVKAVYFYPVYLTYMQSTSCKLPGWMKHKLESRLPGEISITSDIQMTPHLWQKVKRNKEPLDEGERGEWKSWLKTQLSKNKDYGIFSHHFMANTWGNNGNSDRLYFLGLQNHCQWGLQP